ncbi:MAG TPA: hypothetical protein VM076_12095 [Gemmatimonadaceae bacterium]|nr:hypothetical protein [Gemmatimonadaceae bacterium]
MTTLRFAAALATTILLACGSEQPAPPPAVAAPAWHTVAWEPYAGVDPSDLGVGVVYPNRAEDKASTLGTDTLVLRAAPDTAAPAVGAMLFVVGQNGVTSYRVAAADSIVPNLVEHGYEESGVPFDSADASGRWLHALLGTAPNGRVLAGWVDRARPGVGTIRWTEQLAHRPIFFPKPERAAFFATPDSATPVKVPSGGNDAYAMHPEEVRGPWMRVRLVTPSDNCEPGPAPRRTRHVWIRYLDDRGRPNVWYYARGC